jgi:hypothetical protein
MFKSVAELFRGVAVGLVAMDAMGCVNLWVFFEVQA